MSRALAIAATYALVATTWTDSPIFRYAMQRRPGLVAAPCWRSRPDRRTTVAAMKRAARKRRNRARTQP